MAEDLIVALHELIAERGGFPIHIGHSPRAHRAFMRSMEPDGYDSVPEVYESLIDASDAVTVIDGTLNSHEFSDIPPEKTTAFGRLMKPIQEMMQEKNWVRTVYPAPGKAGDAEMSTTAYEDFVYNAVNKDWEQQREFQSQLVDILDGSDEVRIVSGETTDVRLSIDGMVPVNEHAKDNLPGGEVFVAPIPESVEGTVLFDNPVVTQGREVEDARLVFEDGKVVEHDAAKNESVLTAELNTDPGTCRVGELGIGMNRDIDRFTNNMLFDEKMGDMIHLALGALDRRDRRPEPRGQRLGDPPGHDCRHERGQLHRGRRRTHPGRWDLHLRGVARPDRREGLVPERRP